MPRTPALLGPLAALALAAGCAGDYDRLELLPAPLLYTSGAADPFDGLDPAAFAEVDELLYVTGRRPAAPVPGDARAGPRYADARDPLLRAGAARVTVDPPFRDLDEARAVTALGGEGPRRRIAIAEVREIGVLPAGLTDFHERTPDDPDVAAAGDAFARAVESRLALTDRADVFIYVHGYNVNFDYPLLVAREWQHSLGFEGAVVAFAWPATPSRFAYFKDIETAEASVRDLRVLIDFLSERTSVRRVHVIGYSAGSRLVLRMLHQTALLHADDPDPPRLGKVALIGSDVDPRLFLQVLADGALGSVDRLLVYMSGSDSALSISERVLARAPIGRSWDPDTVPPDLQAALARLDRLELIDVTGSDDADAGNGHHYFRTSPWVRSDLMAVLLTQQPAGRRGLVRPAGEARWRFPPDYPARLAEAAEGW